MRNFRWNEEASGCIKFKSLTFLRCYFLLSLFPNLWITVFFLFLIFIFYILKALLKVSLLKLFIKIIIQHSKLIQWVITSTLYPISHWKTSLAYVTNLILINILDELYDKTLGTALTSYPRLNAPHRLGEYL